MKEMEALAAQQIGKKRDERERNRALAAQHMPEFLRLMDGLKEAGMAPRVVSFEIYEQRKAA